MILYNLLADQTDQRSRINRTLGVLCEPVFCQHHSLKIKKDLTGKSDHSSVIVLGFDKYGRFNTFMATKKEKEL